MFSGKPVKGIVHTKMKFESSFTHIGVVLKPYGLLSFMDHKRRIEKKNLIKCDMCCIFQVFWRYTIWFSENSPPKKFT